MGNKKDKKLKKFENQVKLIEILEIKHRKRGRLKLFKNKL